MAAHEDQFTIIHVQSDKVGTFVGHEGVVVWTKLDVSLLNSRDPPLLVIPHKNYKQILRNTLKIHLDKVSRYCLSDDFDPIFMFHQILDADDDEISVAGEGRQQRRSYFWSLPGKDEDIDLFRVDILSLPFFQAIAGVEFIQIFVSTQ